MGDRQRSDEPLVRDPRVLRARVPLAGARDAGHVAGGRAHGAARLRVRGAGRAARQAGLHVHAHRRRPRLLRARDRGAEPVPEDDGRRRALAAGAAHAGPGAGGRGRLQAVGPPRPGGVARGGGAGGADGGFVISLSLKKWHKIIQVF